MVTKTRKAVSLRVMLIVSSRVDVVEIITLEKRLFFSFLFRTEKLLKRFTVIDTFRYPTLVDLPLN